MNQSQFLAITCNLLDEREKSRVQGAIGFGFAFHLLKNWRESFKPITKRGDRNHVITFDSHFENCSNLSLVDVVSIRVVQLVRTYLYTNTYYRSYAMLLSGIP